MLKHVLVILGAILLIVITAFITLLGMIGSIFYRPTLPLPYKIPDNAASQPAILE